MGCDEKPAGDFPYARRPLFKQGVEPEDFKVYISKKDMVTGKNPDDRNYYSEELTGEIAEATPQQTFRQKIVLYGYLYSMNFMKNKALD